MRYLFLATLAACALSVPCQAQPTLALTDAQPVRSPGLDKSAFYRQMIADHGGVVAGKEIWVLGLRGQAPDGRTHDSRWNAGAYGDTLVVVHPDGQVLELRGATHAGLARSAACPMGVSQLRPGHYRAAPLHGRDGDTVWRLTTPDGSETLPTWLDRDGDGVISDQERELDDHYGTTTSALDLVSGQDADQPRSVGSQTLPPEEFETFVAAVGKNERFRYLLIDVNAPPPEETPPSIGPAHPLSMPGPFTFYENLALKKGVKPGFPVLVILLRGWSPGGERHDSTLNMGPYNDTFLVLHRGQGRVKAFLGSSRSGQASTTRHPGRTEGIAQLRPGHYYARSYANYHGLWSWHIVNHYQDHDGYVPAWRDRDKDGFISPQEKALAQSRGVTATDILIHNGVSGKVGNSVGCLTMPPQVMKQFITTVGKGKSFPFLLIDANDPKEGLTSLP